MSGRGRGSLSLANTSVLADLGEKPSKKRENTNKSRGLALRASISRTPTCGEL